jgi:hypothetical protein
MSREGEKYNFPEGGGISFLGQNIDTCKWHLDTSLECIPKLLNFVLLASAGLFL